MQSGDEIVPVRSSLDSANAAAATIVTAQSHRQPLAALSRRQMTAVHNSANTVNVAAAAIVTAESRRLPPTVLSGNEIRPVPNSVDTVNAAAAAILTAVSRRQPIAEPRRKWAGWLSMYFCFGSQKNGRRIKHAALVPEPAPQWTDVSGEEISSHPPPPSSPVSVPSPRIGAPPFSPLSPNSPSPTRTPSIFAIGPYAHETQLVSPPVLSASTTEPSTGLFTPPESVHLTTASSPEVPYAKVLASVNNGKYGEIDDLRSYLNYQGSPIGFQISLSPGNSVTSSPFPDPKIFASSCYPFFPSLLAHESLITVDEEGGDATPNLMPYHMRNVGSLFNGQITEAVPVSDFSARLQHNDHAMHRQTSFEVTVEDVTRGLKKKTTAFGDASTASFRFAPSSSGDHKKDSDDTRAELHIDNSFHDMTEKAKRSLSLRLAKEFNFDMGDATNAEPIVGSDWCGNEKVAGISVEQEKS